MRVISTPAALLLMVYRLRVSVSRFSTSSSSLYLRSAQQLRADQELESYIKWVHLNSFDRKFSPFVMGLLCSHKLGRCYSWQDDCEECDITFDPAATI